MDYKVKCSCGRTLTLSDRLIGKKGKCPSCGKMFDVGMIIAKLRMRSKSAAPPPPAPEYYPEPALEIPISAPPEFVPEPEFVPAPEFQPEPQAEISPEPPPVQAEPQPFEEIQQEEIQQAAPETISPEPDVQEFFQPVAQESAPPETVSPEIAPQEIAPPAEPIASAPAAEPEEPASYLDSVLNELETSAPPEEASVQSNAPEENVAAQVSAETVSAEDEIPEADEEIPEATEDIPEATVEEEPPAEEHPSEFADFDACISGEAPVVSAPPAAVVEPSVATAPAASQPVEEVAAEVPVEPPPPEAPPRPAWYYESPEFATPPPKIPSAPPRYVASPIIPKRRSKKPVKEQSSLSELESLFSSAVFATGTGAPIESPVSGFDSLPPIISFEPFIPGVEPTIPAPKEEPVSKQEPEPVKEYFPATASPMQEPSSPAGEKYLDTKTPVNLPAVTAPPEPTPRSVTPPAVPAMKIVEPKPEPVPESVIMAPIVEEEIPDAIEEIPEAVPEEIPEAIPEEIPEEIPEAVEEIPEAVPEEIPDAELEEETPPPPPPPKPPQAVAPKKSQAPAQEVSPPPAPKITPPPVWTQPAPPPPVAHEEDIPEAVVEEEEEISEAVIEEAPERVGDYTEALETVKESDNEGAVFDADVLEEEDALPVAELVEPASKPASRPPQPTPPPRTQNVHDDIDEIIRKEQFGVEVFPEESSIISFEQEAKNEQNDPRKNPLSKSKIANRFGQKKDSSDDKRKHR